MSLDRKCNNREAVTVILLLTGMSAYHYHGQQNTVMPCDLTQACCCTCVFVFSVHCITVSDFSAPSVFLCSC